MRIYQIFKNTILLNSIYIKTNYRNCFTYSTFHYSELVCIKGINDKPSNIITMVTVATELCSRCL